MMNLLKLLRHTVLGFCLLVGSTLAFAVSDKIEDVKLQEEMTKFCADNAKIRSDHIQALREVHLKHIDELYDRKLVNNKEIDELWKTLKPGDKASKDAIREKIKQKQEAFNKDEDKFRENFRENVLRKMNKDFRDSMDERFKKLKAKHQE